MEEIAEASPVGSAWAPGSAAGKPSPSLPVVQGCYTLIVNGERIPVKAGKEYFVPRGVPHSGEVLAGDQSDPCIWWPPG
jgi:hypothetical protein